MDGLLIFVFAVWWLIRLFRHGPSHWHRFSFLDALRAAWLPVLVVLIIRYLGTHMFRNLPGR